MGLYQELVGRGLVDRLTSEDLEEKLNQGGLTFYVGFDPTAESLHVGQLSVFNTMCLFQKYGHKPIGLMGGATGMIGDPGGKNAERNLLETEQISNNIAGIRRQMEKFLDFSEGNKAILVNNYDWLSKWSFIDFLRDIGKHFSVNMMITRDSVKSRLDREGSGISYTEFSYMLLQSYDFYKLGNDYDCTLQLGGSDQWGNIVSGIDLSRRMGGQQLYGLTMPLVTKSDGNKFGKSEQGTVWLDPKKTSPYEFYQFFVRQADDDVIRFLKVFTQLSLDEIAELEESVKAEPHLRKAQKRLAEEITRVVHGEEGLKNVLQASRVLFGEKIENLDDQTIGEIFKDVPSVKKDRVGLEAGWDLVSALIDSGASPSKGQARKLIQAGGVYINNDRVQDVEKVLTVDDLASLSYLIIRTGKKNYRLIEIQ